MRCMGPVLLQRFSICTSLWAAKQAALAAWSLRTSRRTLSSTTSTQGKSELIFYRRCQIERGKLKRKSIESPSTASRI